jgi:anti-anti-sigma factor
MADAKADNPFTFETERTGQTILVHCHGRLVSGQTDAFYKGLKQLLPGTKRVILDFSDVARLDSMGLGAVVRLYVSAKSAGCTLELTNFDKQVRDLLGVTHLLSVLAIVGEHNIRMG